MYHIWYVIRYVSHMICDIYVIARSALSLYHWYVAHTDMWYMWLLRQCAMCDLWSLRWQAFSPMCDAASQLVVTTNRPNIDPTHLSDVHNTENIDRPLARDLTPKIFSATKSANSCQSIKCASYNFTSLFSQTCLKCPRFILRKAQYFVNCTLWFCGVLYSFGMVLHIWYAVVMVAVWCLSMWCK